MLDVVPPPAPPPGLSCYMYPGPPMMGMMPPPTFQMVSYKSKCNCPLHWCTLLISNDVMLSPSPLEWLTQWV